MDERLHFTVNVPRGLQRFRELIIYVAKQSRDDPWFGAVKLNKILYRSDFLAFERFGVPLTGLRYFRLKAGPAPRAMIPVRRELEAEGAIQIEHKPLGPRDQHRIIPLREPVLEHFTQDEIHLVDEVIRELRPMNATEASNASHDIRWRVLNDRDDLPYEFAFLSDEPVTDDDVKRTKELAREWKWAT
ncbi:MAG TPA: Panacea domain-containing protein [Xanthobacteraceae bacterium]|nr:Panacea domain-containing protein [Xanthobacteraceae bacterium]